MKKIICLLLLFLPFFTNGEDSLLRVMTYNIRYDYGSIFNFDPNRWSMRRAPLAQMIESYDPDILGIQEGIKWQVTDLAYYLPHLAWYGIGREDGKSKGEHAAIYYKKERFDLIDKGTFWLSETPEKPSIGWDANDYRIASWVLLKEKSTDKMFVVLNTHYDHRGWTAREMSSPLIAEKLKTIAKRLPVIIMGDFNTYPGRTLVDKYADSYYKTLNKPEGPHGTLVGDGKFSVEDFKYSSRIDYILTSKPIEVLSYRTINDSKEGNFFSDHLPVLIEAVLKESSTP